MEVKNEIKVACLSTKFALMREMINKTTFISSIIFMMLNNAAFLIQWIILYQYNPNIGGMSFEQIFIIWGIASSTYGVSNFFFKKAYDLSDTINKGGLDTFLVSPKNVLLSAITTDVKVSAMGDMIYGYVMLFIYGVTLKNFLLFTFFTIIGGITLTALAVIFGSLSFWFNKSDMIAGQEMAMMTNFATYPDGIFKGFIKVILYTLVPVGLVNFLPVNIIFNFNIWYFIIVILFNIFCVVLSFLIFYKGLERYSSSNLMNARI
jgi:ABC-2 type transport system permease protein